MVLILRPFWNGTAPFLLDAPPISNMAWLLYSMTCSVMTKVVGLKTSYEIWHRLEVNYSSQIHPQVIKLKNQLRTPKGEGERTVAAYLLDLKEAVDALDCPISSEEHREAILNGLSDDYESIIISKIKLMQSWRSFFIDSGRTFG